MKVSTHIKIVIATFLLIVAAQADTLYIAFPSLPPIKRSWESGAATVTLSPDGTLRVSGAGGMKDYGFLTGDPPWYGLRSLITGLVIENGVTHIGERAFEDLNGLKSVMIPNSVTSIGGRAFGGCTGLTSVTIPRGVKFIENWMFSGCTGLTSITVAEGNAHYSSVDGVVFNKNKNVLIWYPQGKLGAYIPHSVTSIGEYAFSGCKGLTSITVADDNARYSSEDGVLFNKNKTALLKYPQGKQGAYTIPGSVASVGDWAFSGCTGLTSVTIPGSVKTIGESAFRGCTGLTSVTIPGSVKSIGDEAFEFCSGLTSVTISGSVTSIGDRAFEDCAGLTSITVAEDNAHYSSEDGVVFDKNKTVLIMYPPGKLGAYTIPGNVTSIGDRAFYNCKGLTSITIHDGVTSIGMYAFKYCANLTSLTIPNSVSAIGEDAFCWSGPTSIISLNPNPPKTGSSSLDVMKRDKACLYVPKNSIDAYRSADEWNKFECFKDLAFAPITVDGVLFDRDTVELIRYPRYKRGAYTIPNSVKFIKDGAFMGCGGLTSVTIPGSVASIGRSAFEDCAGLTSVTIGDGVESIGDGAFMYCGSLASVTIPDGAASIGNLTFYNCAGLVSVTIPGSVASIGKYAFAECAGLTSVTIKDGVKSIESGAFLGCAGLASVVIPGSVTAIGTQAFAGCAGLASITIPGSVAAIGYGAFWGCAGLASAAIEDGVAAIGSSAFYGCSNLASVTIPGSVAEIGKGAFRGCTGLTSVTIRNPKPPEFGFHTFYGINRDSACLYVPAGSVKAYRASDNWDLFDRIEAIASYKMYGPWLVLSILVMISFVAVFAIMKKSRRLKGKES